MRGYRPGPVAVFFALLVGIFLLMPLLAVVPVSFTPARMLSMPTGALSLRHGKVGLIRDLIPAGAAA